MKRIVSLVLVGALSLVFLSGCPKKSVGPPDDSAEQKQQMDMMKQKMQEHMKGKGGEEGGQE